MILQSGISESRFVKDYKESNVTKTPTVGVTGNLEYVKMLKNPALTVRVVTPNAKVITSALAGNFGFSLQNRWTELVPLSSIPLLSDLAQGAAATLTAVASASQFSLESLWMTSASWVGCELPMFPVQLAFLNYSSQASFISQLMGLAKGALPPGLSYNAADAGSASELVQGFTDWLGDVTDKAATFIESTDFLSKYNLAQNVASLLRHSNQIGTEAPWGYGLEADENASNVAFKPKPHTTYTLRIGNWFEAPNLLVNDISGIQFSKEIAPSGNPLLMTVNVTFRPYRKLYFNEFQKYFKIRDGEDF